MPGSLDACRAKRFGCESHDPLIELVNGSRDVGLPEVRLIRIDPFRLHDSIHSSVWGAPAIAVIALKLTLPDIYLPLPCESKTLTK